MDLKSRMISFLSEQKGSARLLEQVSALSSGSLQELIQLIDDSDFSFEEWMESLVAFDQWETQSGRLLRLEHKIQYLSCCAEGGSQGPKLSLADTLRNYLQTQGVAID